MSVVMELIRVGANGAINFGNYELDSKSKVQDFEHDGDLYKVKSFKEITKLKRNGMFVYESVPGTAVFDLIFIDGGLSFKVSGKDGAQITVELEAETEYEILVDDSNLGKMKTNLSGKLMFSLEFKEEMVDVKIVKI
jgi:hypothetical protein